MPDLSTRSTDIEIMDDLACSGEVVEQTLRELENINYLLGGNYVTLDGIEKLLANRSKQSFKLADLGCGSGDILRIIRRWSVKKNIDLDLIGIDANPFIVRYAQEHTPAEYNIRYKVADIFSGEFSREQFDLVTGTLFFHHFTSTQLVLFFAQLKKQTRVGFVINDIHRHVVAYYSIKWLTKMFSRSAMVKYDAPLSVWRAFRKNELIEILKQAGITNYTIKWMWAFRWQVVARTS
jgi:2-polyprenyl-3-methyl-5-hydroxy-6-metoxy-1,4-benzoquinol methylase